MTLFFFHSSSFIQFIDVVFMFLWLFLQTISNGIRLNSKYGVQSFFDSIFFFLIFFYIKNSWTFCFRFHFIHRFIGIWIQVTRKNVQLFHLNHCILDVLRWCWTQWPMTIRHTFYIEMIYWIFMSQIINNNVSQPNNNGSMWRWQSFYSEVTHRKIPLIFQIRQKILIMTLMLCSFQMDHKYWCVQNLLNERTPRSLGLSPTNFISYFLLLEMFLKWVENRPE